MTEYSVFKVEMSENLNQIQIIVRQVLRNIQHSGACGVRISDNHGVAGGQGYGAGGACWNDGRWNETCQSSGSRDVWRWLSRLLTT